MSFAVVFGGRGIEQIFLLLDRREFGIALVDDQIHQGIANGLIGNLANSLPFLLAFEIAKLDLWGMELAQFGFEPIVAEQCGIVADVFLPLMEIVDPVIES